jgi:hypothetical protein
VAASESVRATARRSDPIVALVWMDLHLKRVKTYP